MSGECSNCGEHTLECLCKADPVIGAAASLLAWSIQETRLKLAFESIQKSGLWDEFNKFYMGKQDQYVWTTIDEFCAKYPDVFMMPNQDEQYSKFVVIEKTSKNDTF
jgi:hypothetical protein